MFPYLMKKNTYRYLSGVLDLHYYPLYSWELLDDSHNEFYGVELMNEMYFYNNCVATNITSFDALNVHACNAASKNYPIVINIDVSFTEGKPRVYSTLRPPNSYINTRITFFSH